MIERDSNNDDSRDGTMGMTLTEYERATDSTAIYPGAGTGSMEAIQYVALKLASEAGEIAGKVGKAMRDGWSMEELFDELLPEDGDVLWYVARLAREIGPGLDAVARYNLDKLDDRKARGVLQGSGDRR